MPTRKTIFFTGPRQVEIREEPIPTPQPDEVLVETICSAISPGSEMLVYRGQFPSVPDAHDTLSSDLSYPLAYGYAAVGRIVETGSSVDGDLAGKLVFAFQPHTSHFTAPPSALLFLPEDISPETACFLPNMETAVNLVQDTAPILGERGLVLGQGIVGLLVTALLHEFPLERLVTTDLIALRREESRHLGAASLDADSSGLDIAIATTLNGQADFTIEISGSPSALDTAIRHTGYGGRIIIGSWYGEKKAALDLGGAFHRSRIQLIASQVSTIRPELSARWDKLRRFGVAWDALRRIGPEQWITQRFPLAQAAEAFRLLDEDPGQSIQVIFTHQDKV